MQVDLGSVKNHSSCSKGEIIPQQISLYQNGYNHEV